MVNENEDLFWYMMKWIAHGLQKPHSRKNLVALLLKSEPGSGKNTLGLILKKIYGRHFYECSKNAELYGDFVYQGYEENMLVFVNEASGLLQYKNEDILKGLITDTTKTCNQKYKQKMVLDNYSRYIFATNNENSIKIAKNDRRF
jgi:phage/plasmid-associated DNA primase